MGNSMPDVDREQELLDEKQKIEYCLDERFVLSDGKKHKLAIICPGGGYERVCSFIEGTPIARRLNALGISAFIVYYRCKTPFPAPLDDLAKAVRFILENAEKYNLETENYSVWGASAGGHLAACFGTESLGYPKYNLPKPGAIILEYPVISMDKSITHLGSRENLIGNNPTAQLEALTSLENQVTSAYPRAFFWCGKDDTSVPCENSIRFAKALENSKIDHCFTLYESAPHGLGPGTGSQAEGWIERAVNFWINQN